MTLLHLLLFIIGGCAIIVQQFLSVFALALSDDDGALLSLSIASWVLLACASIYVLSLVPMQ